MEGVWGLLICTCILYPIAGSLPGNDHGVIEDPENTLTLIANSGAIQRICVLYFFSVSIYNIFSVLITFLLNSVWHAIFDNFRPVVVWVFDLFIYYFINPDFGEQWTKGWSWLQVLGLITLLYGTAVYNGSVKLPGFEYEWTPEGQEGGEGPVGMKIRTPKALASPALGKSPLLSRQTELRKVAAQEAAAVVELSMSDAKRAFNDW